MDKDFTFVLLAIGGTIVAIALFLGFVQGVGKTFKPAQQINKINSEKMLRDQKIRMDQIKDHHRQLIQQQQQKVRDFHK